MRNAGGNLGLVLVNPGNAGSEKLTMDISYQESGSFHLIAAHTFKELSIEC